MNRTPVRQIVKDVGHIQDPDQIAAALGVMVRKLERAAHERRGQDRINLLAARQLLKNALDLLPDVTGEVL
jgi:hypothetical protein